MICKFLNAWFRNILAKATSSLNLIAIITTLVGGAGFTAGGHKFGIFLLIVLGVYLICIAALSLPPRPLRPRDYSSKMVTIGDLSKFPKSLPRVALIGKQNVGKTTFLDLTAARVLTNRQTAVPMAQITAIPDDPSGAFLAIVDSVGQQDHVQFSMQTLYDILLVFLDHSESNSSITIDQERLDLHKYFCEQLIAALEPNARHSKSILLVLNKSDLWSGSSSKRTKMLAFLDDIREMFLRSGGYRSVESVPEFSNTRAGSAAELLRKAAELAK